MRNDFVERIKNMELELLNLKTAAEYSSVRSANLAYLAEVTTGIYRIHYEQSEEPIIAMFYKNDNNRCYLYGRTPSGNTQDVEVLTTYWSNPEQRYITDTSSMTVVSNIPVTSIERIS